jgi:streptomycin 6-kinase
MRVAPGLVVANCRGVPERERWLAGLDAAVDAACERWGLVLGRPFDGPEVSAAWVAPAVRHGGERVVLKLGMPHAEAADEARGLALWAGDPTVRLIDVDDRSGAMLLERCEPGTPLRALPEGDQDAVIGAALRRLHRPPPPDHGLRPLSTMLAAWAAATRRAEARWSDAGLVLEGLTRMEELLRSTTEGAMLATDLHAGNVLAARREPWLVIDPKPFVGDPAYDVTQHLLNGLERLRAAPRDTVARVAELAGLDVDRVGAWTFVRLVVEPIDGWSADGDALARALA